MKEIELVSEILEGTETKPIYVKSVGKKIFSWWLYLRAASEWVQLCYSCNVAIDTFLELQEELQLEHTEVQLHVHPKETELSLGMIDGLNERPWLTLCADCHKTIRETFLNSLKVFLGNDAYSPGVELQKKGEIDDKVWTEVDRHPATQAEVERLSETAFTDFREN